MASQDTQRPLRKQATVDINARHLGIAKCAVISGAFATSGVRVALAAIDQSLD
jgi:ABC-type arginine transport system permease subunit